MTGNEIRKKFLDYFEKHQHRIVRSSSLVPHDDPTLLFTNAGMVQFKRCFLGEEKRDYVRATTSQKCVRAGGKHNDLENVGYTARHHTFFEMLGNFSFGDYFKEKAIEFGWDLLTNGYSFPEDKLWVSIYLDDDEADAIWQKNVGVPPERIVRFGEKDNFWAMGDTGPCGPCSEIHIDRGAAHGCGKPDCKIGCDCDRYLEIWNLVFMQFNRDASGQMTPLPKPSIDTGLGLERVVSVMQDVDTNYETDLIKPIMHKVEDLSGKKLGEAFESDVAMKVIADHSRAAAFLIGDGILPSNEGRGYVLRRIMRRAIRYGRNIGLMQPFMKQTAETVFDIMEPAYPDLKEAAAFITNVIENEELRFSETLDHGLNILSDTLGELRAKGETVVPGSLIFKLYDTYGFPVDIVQDVVRDEKLDLGMDEFEALMNKQREQSRSVISFGTMGEAYKQLSSQGITTRFVGYDTLNHTSQVLVLVHDGQEVEEAHAESEIELVVTETPFYGESGGQVGDNGRIIGVDGNDDLEISVIDTIKDPTGIFIHKGRILSGTLQKDANVRLSVDEAKREATKRNHTATHILHAVLREVIGDHVKQAGSLVAPDRMRFDFTHFAMIEQKDLDDIERRVNTHIRDNVTTGIEEMDAEQAFQSGATALFEEKYGDRVRVISLGAFSKELCGGTHAESTGSIGLFKIVSESSVAAGVRRIEAVTGEEAVEQMQQAANALNETAHLIKDKPENVPQRIKALLAHQKTFEKEIDKLKTALATQDVADFESEIKEIAGIKVLAKKVAVDTPAALRELADRLKDKVKSGVVVLGSVVGSKALLIAVVTQDLTSRLHAGKIVKEVASVVGGGGGGRPDMAQAGGTQPERIDQAIEKVYEIVGA
jgi:alanyl-tRNA synthetase